jgi:hypothetical protein
VVPQFDVGTAEARKRSIEQRLLGALMTVLQRDEHISEWVVINDALKPVPAQLEQKPKGGRPHGGVAEAARNLPLPGSQSDSARRQFVRRAIRIAKIYPAAKDAARDEKLDDNQTALLAIAAEETEEAQIEIAKTWRRRNRQGPQGPSDVDGYTVTGLGHLDAAAKQSLDAAIKALVPRFCIVVKHIALTTTTTAAPEETAWVREP